MLELVPMAQAIKLQNELSQIVKNRPNVAKIVPIIKVANNPFAIPPRVTVKKFKTFFFMFEI